MLILIVIPPHGDAEAVVGDLLAAGRKLQALRASEIQIVTAGPDASRKGQKTAEATGHDVCSVPIEDPADATADTLTAILADFVPAKAPACILLPHTAAGLDIAAALAAEINAACITGVEKIDKVNNRICFTREIFNGKLTTSLIAEIPKTVITAQTGAFAGEPQRAKAPGRHTVHHFDKYKGQTRFKGIHRETEDTASLDQADILVAAGNGIGEKENLELIHQLAGLFAKSAVCGSRPVCDKNWLPHRLQVGVTGAVVAPKLYIACGISGASQHIAGIRQAKFIVAINKDPRAAIFNFADVCIIEDLSTFIPLLIEAYKTS